ncbi:MAG: hypothetical protein ACP5EP_08540, partial [Acidobacteriaceae bacterium]
MRKLSLLSVLAVAVTGALMGCGGAKFTGTLNPGSGGTPIYPAVYSISPTSAVEGGAPFTLTVEGVNFTSSTVVVWNNTDLT